MPKTVTPVHTRRSYQRTSFFLFIACVVITMASEYFGVSVNEVTDYTGNILHKTFENISTVLIWAVPLIVAVKEVIGDWAKVMADKDIKIAEIMKTSHLPKVKPE